MTSRNESIQAQSELITAIYGRNDAFSDEPGGIAAYRRSLIANAKRALAISFPTIAQLLGNDFAASSRDFLQHHPFNGGDWGEWGEEFPNWLAVQAELEHLPYLKDCAQLDWFCHQSERAANQELDLDSLALLGEEDAYGLNIKLCSGVYLLESAYPVVNIWQTHQSQTDNFKPLLAAARGLAEEAPQTALVWRPQWKAQVCAIEQAEAAWLKQLLSGASLGEALDNISDTDFNFEHWLPEALQKGLFIGIQKTTIK